MHKGFLRATPHVVMTTILMEFIESSTSNLNNINPNGTRRVKAKNVSTQLYSGS